MEVWGACLLVNYIYWCNVLEFQGGEILYRGEYLNPLNNEALIDSIIQFAGSIPFTMYIPSLLQVNLHREKVTWPGAIVQKAGEGMPNYEDNTRRGNLYITIDVDFPRGTFSDEDQEGLQMSPLFCFCGCVQL